MRSARLGHQLAQAREAARREITPPGANSSAVMSPRDALLHLAARDLDLELALEAEHDVEEVERLGAEVGHQDRRRA